MSARTGRIVSALRIVALVVAVGSYPFAVASSLDHVSARAIGALLLAVTLALAVTTRPQGSRLLGLALRRFGLLFAVSIAATATNQPVVLKLLPTITSLWLLATFASSLRGGPTIVEQFALAVHERFPAFLAPYCRRVTIVWCVFFTVNAIVAAILAAAATDETWAYYTGFLSYLLMAALGAGEYVFHKMRFRFYENGPADRLWRRVLPPHRTVLGRRTLDWQLQRASPRSAASRASRGALQ